MADDEFTAASKHAKDMRNQFATKLGYDLFICPYGCISLVTVSEHPSLIDFLSVACPKCLKTWMVCARCTGTRSILKNDREVSRHISQKHKDIRVTETNSYKELKSMIKKKRKKYIDENEMNEQDIFKHLHFIGDQDTSDLNDGIISESKGQSLLSLDNYKEDLDADTKIAHVKTTKQMKRSFPQLVDIGLDMTMDHTGYFNEKNKVFIHKNKDGKGGAYLVGLSQFELTTLKDKISPEDVRINLKISNVTFKCSKRIMSDFCSVLKDLKSIHQGGAQELKHMWQCHIPDCYNDICLNVTDSNRSIWKMS
jgi:hypothetical protein